MVAFALTTIDNPFDPFDQFEQWQSYDEQMGYYSCAYLARIARTSDELSEEDQTIAVNDAIDEIVSMNLSGLYKKVSKEFAE